MTPQEVAPPIEPQKPAPNQVPPANKVVGKRPERQKGMDHFTEAMKFLAQASEYMNKVGIPLTAETVPEIYVLWRRYSNNVGLRGKDKEKIRRIIDGQMSNLKAMFKNLKMDDGLATADQATN